MNQYIPKPDAEGINSPPATPLWDLLILLAGFLGTLVLLYFLIAETCGWMVQRAEFEKKRPFKYKQTVLVPGLVFLYFSPDFYLPRELSSR